MARTSQRRFCRGPRWVACGMRKQAFFLATTSSGHFSRDLERRKRDRLCISNHRRRDEQSVWHSQDAGVEDAGDDGGIKDHKTHLLVLRLLLALSFPFPRRLLATLFFLCFSEDKLFIPGIWGQQGLSEGSKWSTTIWRFEGCFQLMIRRDIGLLCRARRVGVTSIPDIDSRRYEV